MQRTLAVVVVLITLAFATPVWAGAYGKIGGGLSTSAEKTDCSRRTPTTEAIPAWSRFQWSLSGGMASRNGGGEWDHGAVLVPQASFGLWLRDSACTQGTGWFSTDEWVRWSLAFSADAAWRSSGPDAFDVRPALRVSREKYADGLLSVGSSWVPSVGFALTVGPTFDPSFSGGAASVSLHASILSIELRGGLRTGDRGEEILLLFGVADLHGLMDLGSRKR